MSHRQLMLAVGPGRPNRYDDVKLVQQLLNRSAAHSRPLLVEDGFFGRKTEAAITHFQRVAVVMRFPDGIVDVNGVTWRKLDNVQRPHAPHPQPKTPHTTPKPGGGPLPVPTPPAGGNRVLSEADYQAAAKILACDEAAIKAVAATETGVCGTWDAQGRPSILYERHYFSRLTKGQYDRTHGDISSPVGYGKTKLGYGKCAAQYDKMGRAAVLDRKAALMSASWGKFQLMGEYYQDAGYGDIDAFVHGMQSSVQAQLTAFVQRILNNSAAHSALQHKRWAQFAAAYNGPGWKANDYDTKMAQHYAEAGGK